MKPALSFHKVEGLGNDFILVDRLVESTAAIESSLSWFAREAPRLCDRRTGIGADGLLLVGPSSDPGAQAKMIVINHDGSRPEMCGNGIRCAALFVGHRLGMRALGIESDAGQKRCRVLSSEHAGTRGHVAVDMGAAKNLGEVEAAATTRRFHAISLGNPHAVTFVGKDDDPEQLARSLGPAIEIDAVFPGGTNVEFVRCEDDGSLTVWVWERGVGITRACGTGACASAVAAVRCGAIEPGETHVRLPGGTLDILVPGDPSLGIEMCGPARVVFSGVLV